MKDKLTGTIKNEDADKRVESLVSNDSRIANPRNKHLKLNREVGSLASLDNIILARAFENKTYLDLKDGMIFSKAYTKVDSDEVSCMG